MFVKEALFWNICERGAVLNIWVKEVLFWNICERGAVLNIWVKEVLFWNICEKALFSYFCEKALFLNTYRICEGGASLKFRRRGEDLEFC
jgi:hypothetical protein